MRWAIVQVAAAAADRHDVRFAAEQAALPALRASAALAAWARIVSAAANTAARLGQRVERAGAGEAFELAAVEQPRIDPLGEIVERS
jgi:hypothetical protein